MGCFSPITHILFLLLCICGTKATDHNVTSAERPVWTGDDVQDLWNEYYNIFPSRNRNAAAFRWSTFLLERSWQMTAERFEHLAGGYCAVAAAIVDPKERTRYRLKLPVIGGGEKEGLMYYCCWPCICDTLDFLKVDTKTVTLKDGVTRTYHFAVMGDPCDNPSALSEIYICPFSGQPTTISQQAPEVVCDMDGNLKGATKSDHGHIIMSMFFEDQYQAASDQSYYTGLCEQRAEDGYSSGMGLIFRKVAGASPITNQEVQSPENQVAGAAMRGSSRKQKSSHASRSATKDSVGSAAVHDPDNVLTCPNGKAGVPKFPMNRVRNISKVQLLMS